jgi:hypothetical protein
MTRALATAAAAIAAAACSYDFTNPAEQLARGQVAGRVVADASGTGTWSAMPGVSVALENSPYDQTTRETGRFTLLGMPAGRHTIVFRKGATWALQRDVEVGYGPDGQPEGVAIGDVRLRYTVTLRGAFSVPASPAFLIDPATAVVEDEATGARAALASGGAPGRIAYTFQGLPVGTHRIRFGASGQLLDPLLGYLPQGYVGGPIAIDVPESSEGQALTLNPVAANATGTGSGRLQFKIAIVASRPVDPAGAVVVLTPTPPGGDPVPDSTGLVDADLPEGVYTLDVFPPIDHAAGGQPIFLQPPPRRTLAIGEDQITELGVLYAVEDAVAAGSASACFEDADCVPGTCSGGFCAGWTPAPVAPVSVPFCSDAADCVSAACTPCADGFGTCASGARGELICVPLGVSACTPDGVEVVLNTCIG